MRSRLIRLTSLLALLVLPLFAGPAGAATRPTEIFDNGNVAAVQNGATRSTIFTTSKEWKIVELYTYHWNDAKGTATPGTIGLRNLGTKKTYGPWRASGLPGQGGVMNAYWIVRPKVDIPPGRYQVLDSSPATWSQNSGTGGAGMAIVIALPAGFAWPAMPSALVPLASVANGCGPGTASKDPRWGDTSVYKDSGKSYLVNFREACNVHDAGYSGARVRDPLHGNRVVDFWAWNQKQVDDRFLDDMRILCRRQIPATAEIARVHCEGHGGLTSFGAQNRFEAVQTIGYWVFLDRPRVSGVWRNAGDPTDPALALTQVARDVKGSWRGGGGDAKARGEFRGTLISRDTDSIVRGYVKYTDGEGNVSLKQMTITLDPKRRDRIVVAGAGMSGTYDR